MKNNPLIWGAIGALLMASIAVFGRLQNVEMPVGFATASVFSIAASGFFWGFVVCSIRNWMMRQRHG